MKKLLIIFLLIIAVGATVLIVMRYKRRSIHKLLYRAAKKGRLAKVKELVEKGASVNYRTRRGRTPLYGAANKGNETIVAYLLSLKDKDGKLVVDVSMVDEDQETPLHAAADEGYCQVVRLLVQEGNADVNKQDVDGDTPLHEAADEGHLDIVTFLIKSGADPTIKNKKGRTPLDEAIDEKRYDVVKYLKESSFY